MSGPLHLPRLDLTGEDALKINTILAHFREFRPIYNRLAMCIARAEAPFAAGMVYEAAVRGNVRVAYQMMEMPERFSEGLRISAARQGAMPAGFRKIFGLTVSDRLFRFIQDETDFDLKERIFFRYLGECVDAALMGETLFDIGLQLDDQPLISLRVALSEASLSRLFGLMGGSVEAFGIGPADLPLVDVAVRLCAIDVPLEGAAAMQPGDLVMIGRFQHGFQHMVINGSAVPLLVEDEGNARLDVES